MTAAEKDAADMVEIALLAVADAIVLAHAADCMGDAVLHGLIDAYRGLHTVKAVIEGKA